MERLLIISLIIRANLIQIFYKVVFVNYFILSYLTMVLLIKQNYEFFVFNFDGIKNSFFMKQYFLLIYSLDYYFIKIISKKKKLII